MVVSRSGAPNSPGPTREHLFIPKPIDEVKSIDQLGFMSSSNAHLIDLRLAGSMDMEWSEVRAIHRTASAGACPVTAQNVLGGALASTCAPAALPMNNTWKGLLPCAATLLSTARPAATIRPPRRAIP
jgi:hypothetical protein